MNSSRSASTVVPRRARRRRASLTLYGSPLRASQSHASSDLQTDLPDVPSASRPITEGTPAPGTERDTDALIQAIDRVQAEARRDATLTCLLSASELDRMVESFVRELWHDSPIKTFVPVLALRQTRDRLLIPMTE